MMTNTGPINVNDDVATRPFTLSEITEAQSGRSNNSTVTRKD